MITIQYSRYLCIYILNKMFEGQLIPVGVAHGHAHMHQSSWVCHNYRIADLSEAQLYQPITSLVRVCDLRLLLQWYCTSLVDHE